MTKEPLIYTPILKDFLDLMSTNAPIEKWNNFLLNNIKAKFAGSSSIDFGKFNLYTYTRRTGFFGINPKEIIALKSNPLDSYSKSGQVVSVSLSTKNNIYYQLGLKDISSKVQPSESSHNEFHKVHYINFESSAYAEGICFQFIHDSNGYTT